MWWVGYNLENLSNFQYWLIWAFFVRKREPKIFPTLYSIPFLSVLPQTETLHNFHKREQRPTIRRIKVLYWGLIGRPTSLVLRLSNSLHKRDWVRLTYCHGRALQLGEGDTIKEIKIIRCSFELTKVIKCSMFWKS